MDAQIVQEIWEAVIKPELLWLIFQLISLGIIIAVGKSFFTTVAAFVAFRTNKDIGKNVKIIMKGREAIITHYTMRFIFVRFKDKGTEMIIPMKRWENTDWELIKNGNS